MAQPFVDSSLHFGRFTLQPARKLLLEDRQPVRIGSRALDLLVALAQRPGEVLSREELETFVWPRSVVEETSLRVHASRLRKVLRDGEDGARYIVNVPGRGYAFVAEITRDPVEPRAATAEAGPQQRLADLLTAALKVVGDVGDPKAAALANLLRAFP